MVAAGAMSTHLTKVKPFDALCSKTTLRCLQIFQGIKMGLKPTAFLALAWRWLRAGFDWQLSHCLQFKFFGMG